MRARASVAINSNEIVIAPQAQARLAAPVAAETVAVRESSNHPALWLGAPPRPSHSSLLGASLSIATERKHDLRETPSYFWGRLLNKISP